jgi:hypothetical protein
MTAAPWRLTLATFGRPTLTERLAALPAIDLADDLAGMEGENRAWCWMDAFEAMGA